MRTRRQTQRHRQRYRHETNTDTTQTQRQLRHETNTEADTETQTKLQTRDATNKQTRRRSTHRRRQTNRRVNRETDKRANRWADSRMNCKHNETSKQRVRQSMYLWSRPFRSHAKKVTERARPAFWSWHERRKPSKERVYSRRVSARRYKKSNTPPVIIACLLSIYWH